MNQSPGHHEHPGHHVHEERPGRHVWVAVNGIPVASTTDAIRVVEDGQPPRLYLPRTDVQTAFLQGTDTTRECPFKGHASYYTLAVAGEKFPDAVWSYESPYAEHRDLKDRVAFDTETYPDILVETRT